MKSANNILMYLRLVSNHPLLLSEFYATDNFRQANFSKANKELLNEAGNDIQEIKTIKDLIRDSGKM